MNDQARTLVPDTTGAATPAVLLPYQQRWVADPANLKVCEKGRRTGLTWAEAADDVLIAASAKEAGGQNVYYLGTDKEMTEEFIGACAMWAKAFNHAAGAIEDGFWDEDEDDRHIKTYTIRFPASGHRITALASRPRKLRGRQGVLVGDEAAFVDDLPELLKAAVAFLIWGGKVRIISTHDGADNEFNGLVQEVRAGKRRGSVHKVTFRGAVEEGLFQRICLRLGKEYSSEAEAAFVDEIYGTYGDAAEEELDCVPRNSGGAYLSRPLVESRMSADTPILRIERPDGWELLPEQMRRADVQDWLEREVDPLLVALQARRREIRGSLFGYDFARYVDLSIMAPQVESLDLNRRVPFAIEMRRIPYDQQRQILFHVADRLPKLRAGAMDAVGNGSWLAEVAQQRYGERIHRVAITEGFYGENFPKLKADLQDGTLDGLPRHADWLDDLRTVESIKGVPRIPAKRTTGRDGGKRHGDAAVALVLGTSVAAVEYVPIEFQSTGPRQAAMDAIGRGYGDTGFGSVPGGNDFGGFA